MMRHGWLLGVLIGLAASAAGAQETPAQGTAPQATAATPAQPRPTQAVRRPRHRVPAKPAPLDVTKHPAQVPPPRSPDLQAGALAPMPNRDLEGPRAIPQDRTRLDPSVINRNLPGRGQAADGSPTLLEEKLFRPAPGARLRVPFSY